MSSYDEAKVAKVSKIIREEFEACEVRVCERLGQALGLKPQTAKASKKASDIVELGIDVSGITFYQKNKAKAGLDASWGWCFPYTQEGEYHPESRELVQAIEQYGIVKVGDREYTLGGRDGNLLQMKRVPR